ncbi:MAG TPA: TonB family protein, partial [Thermoanaerobaculia bacterium]|nr:TonB family protein [Thermoanaerobaculia bacterium]
SEPGKKPVPAAPAPPPHLRGSAAAAPSSRKPVWIAAAGALLILAALGLWLAQRPANPARVAAAPSPSSAATPEPAATPVSMPAPAVLPRAQTPVEPVPQVVEVKPGPKPKPSPAEPKAPSAPLEPMKAGDPIRRGQPNVEEPEVKTLASYAYPAAAKGSGKKVTIRLAVLVDETGQVIDTQIREGDKSGLGFEEAAVAAAKKTRFFPATRDGIAGRMWTELLLDFSE